MNDTVRTLFKNAWIVSVTNEDSLPYRGWLLVEGRHIAGLGEGKPPVLNCDRTIECQDKALLPGLVNTHAHSMSSLTRGSAEGMRLEEWLKHIGKEQAVLTDEHCYWAALATFAEALLSGTTCIVDMCLFPSAVLRAANDVGIRCIVAPYVGDRIPFTPSLSDTRDMLSQGTGTDRTTVWSAAVALEVCSDEQISEAAALAAEFSTGFHVHAAETQRSVKATTRRTGREQIAQLGCLGILGKNTLLAHCVWANDREQDLLAESGTHVSHCPHSNAKLASGIAPIPAMLKKGINVCLGTDGAKANNRLDMFDVMKLTSLLHKAVHLDPTVLRSPKVLALATAHGGQALKLAVGSLTVGLLADLILVDLGRLHLQPPAAQVIVPNIVHSARGSDVELVMVEGSIVVDGGKLVSLDESAIIAQVQEIASSLLRSQ